MEEEEHGFLQKRGRKRRERWPGAFLSPGANISRAYKARDGSGRTARRCHPWPVQFSAFTLKTMNQSFFGTICIFNERLRDLFFFCGALLLKLIWKRCGNQINYLCEQIGLDHSIGKYFGPIIIKTALFWHGFVSSHKYVYDEFLKNKFIYLALACKICY